MFRIRKEFRFEASHILPYHNGKCRDLHGHSYRLIIECQGRDLQADGPSRAMLLDFAVISKHLKPFIEEYLDHKHLNDSLAVPSPTAEIICELVYRFCHEQAELRSVVAVEVWETATSMARLEAP